MGNNESHSVKSHNRRERKYHPQLKILCQKLKAASAARRQVPEGCVDPVLFKALFRLPGPATMTHLPSSPSKGGKSPSERSHKAPTPSIGDYFFNYLTSVHRGNHSHGASSDELRIDDFLYGSQEIIDCMSEAKFCAEMYAGLNTHKDEHHEHHHHGHEIDELHLRHALITCFLLQEHLQEKVSALTLEDQYLLNALVLSIMNSKNTVSKDEFLSWVYQHCPRLFASTHSWLLRALVDPKGPVLSNPELNDHSRAAAVHVTPETAHGHEKRHTLNSQSSCASLSGTLHSKQVLCPMLTWLLSCILSKSFYVASSPVDDAPLDPVLERIEASRHPTQWELLYNSNTHGLSMNRFQHHVFSYKGHTVMLLELEAGDLYVVGADTEWKESTTRFGGIDSVILEAQPQFRIRETGREILYLNEWGRSLPKGLILGHDPKAPLLKIDSGLDLCTLSNGFQQNIRTIEVWGCSSLFALDQQRSQKKWEDNEARKGQNVRKEAAFGEGGRSGWENNPDRLLLEFGGVTTRHNQRN